MGHRFTIFRGRAFATAALPLVLSLVPGAGAAIGALIDERRHLGFTNWRSACRATGISPGSVVAFTFELLPTAIIGALLGGLAVQVAGILARRGDAARSCLAAHLGCALAMPVGLAVCALGVSPFVMLVTDATLAAAAAFLMLRLLAKPVQAVARHP